MLTLPTLAGVLALPILGSAQVLLKTAADFGVIASTAITSTGLSVVNGDVGITPNDRTSITGFPPGIVTGTIEAANARAVAARNDAVAAYNAAAASTVTTDLTGQDLGGQVLAPGVYGFSSSAGLTGVLTLDGQGDPESVFVIKIGSTLTTATASSVILVNGARACNVFFQVGSSATLGTGTRFAGSILALTSITANSGVTVDGGLYALNAAVTLISDEITAPGNCSQDAPSSALVSVSNTAVQSTTTTGALVSQTTFVTGTITREASLSGKPKETKTRKGRMSTKTPSNCACRGDNGAVKTCVCQGSDKGEEE